MLTNTERQQIVEEVNAGTYGIDEALDDIAAAQKGEEVRKALYAEALVLNREGHAGSTDMIARQKIANLQTSVNGQISTFRTEVGEDIDDLEEALNSGLATQNGRIAAQDATIAGVVANYNVEYGSTELWASTGETGALAAGTTVTLSEDVSHFDYIDIYSFLGNNNILDTLPVDAKLQSNDGYALRWVNLSDPGSGTYEAYVRIIETKIKIIGTTLTIIHQVTYSNGASVSISGAEITSSNRSTYVGELGIMKIVGRKITANTEIEDVRIGADGTEYASAGQAVRAQIEDVADAIPAIDTTLSVSGAAADAAAVGAAIVDAESSGSGITDDIKQALLDCFANVAWINSGGRGYYDALEEALYPPANLVRITAEYTQSGVVYDNQNLEDLQSKLIVTAIYDDSSSAIVSPSHYSLGGSLTEGTSVITVSYRGKTASFDVTVTHATVQYSISNVLDHVTSSNAASAINENASYNATLTPSSSYQISTVTVVMGGVDITSTAYSNGVINIASVTADVTITATAIYVPSMVTDGLVTYFDGRTCEYNPTANGGKTVIYSSDGNYSSYSWANNVVISQDAVHGLKLTGRMNNVATVKDGTSPLVSGDEWTIVVQMYGEIFTNPIKFIAASNVASFAVGAPYTKTGGTKTYTSRTNVTNGYGGNTAQYMPFIMRASATKFELFDTTGNAVYTKNASDISEFQSWAHDIGFSNIGTSRDDRGLTFFAYYNKALSDAQVLDMVEYVHALEV